MKVVEFKSGAPYDGAPWRASEFNRLVESFAADLSTGQSSGWAVGATETGDAQFYLLGPPPEEDCILCISRLGGRYVLEDGRGRVLFEHSSLMVLADQAGRVLRNARSALVGRVVLLWYATRHAIQEKLEPVLGEVEETLVHVAPQLVALA